MSSLLAQAARSQESPTARSSLGSVPAAGPGQNNVRPARLSEVSPLLAFTPATSLTLARASGSFPLPHYPNTNVLAWGPGIRRRPHCSLELGSFLRRGCVRLRLGRAPSACPEFYCSYSRVFPRRPDYSTKQHKCGLHRSYAFPTGGIRNSQSPIRMSLRVDLDERQLGRAQSEPHRHLTQLGIMPWGSSDKCSVITPSTDGPAQHEKADPAA